MVMSSGPLVSVCIPLFNKCEHLAKTVGAILQQTYSPLEVVLSDNGSDDGSERIAQEFARRDQRVRYYRLRHTISVSQSWRCAWRLAQGEFVKIHSGDDTSLQRDFLERMVETMLRQPELGFTLCEARPVVEYTETGLSKEGF